MKHAHTAAGGAGGTGVLIEALVERLEPVRPLRALRVYATCLALELAVVVTAAWQLGVSVSVLGRLGQPFFFSIAAILLLTAVGCTVVAVRSAVPGRAVQRWVAATLLLMPLLLASAVALLSPWGSTWKGLAVTLSSGTFCMETISLIALLPWLGGLVVLRRLAPVREIASGLLLGLAAFSSGAFVMQLACPALDGYHLMFAHYLPTALGAAVLGLVAAAVLRASTSAAERRARAAANLRT